jgi:spectinomycin phosphotransferase
VMGAGGPPRFVTVDDLDGKDWLGETREAVFGGLSRALDTAAALRHEAGLEFVAAAVPDRDGQRTRRVDERYAVSVFPFLTGHSHPFGPYPDAELRSRALDMITAVHQATAVVRETAPRHRISFTGSANLEAFLRDPGLPWDGGPFSAAGHRIFTPYAAELAGLLSSFDELVEATAAARANLVITHGEPHPANVMSVDGGLALIDWDTAGLAPPERDMSLIAAGDTGADTDIARYQGRTGRELDPAVITLYRLRWYLDDLGSMVSMFRNPHSETRDTRRWMEALVVQLELATGWRATLDR